MLSTANVSGQQVAEYYEKDNYYMRDKSVDAEKLGEWQGKLRDQYNLPEDITKQDFDRFVSEKDKRAGTDLTFSAPKSVSMAMHLHPDMKDDIFSSHKEAVSKTLSFIEENFTGYRQNDQYGHKERKRSDNFLVAKFDHLTSRALDPQLHSHCIILNQTYDENGRKWAMNNEEFFSNKIYLGQIYRNELGRFLQEKGYDLEITDRKHGFFEIKGFNQEQLEEFSKRAQEIAEFVKEKNWNENDPAAKAAATILTRKAKQSCDLELQKKAWSEQFKDAGISSDQISKSPGQSITPMTEQEKADFFSRVDKNISRKTVAFTSAEYSKAALREGLGLGIVQKDIDTHIERALETHDMRVTERSRLQRTQNGVTRVKCEYYGTREAIELEQKLMNRLENGKDKSSGISADVVDNYLRDLKLEGISLTPGQQEAIKHIATSQDRYVVVQGFAGTGKSFMFKHLQDLHASQDTKNQRVLIQGLGFTGQAADNLYKSSGIKSKTIHSYLNYLERESGGVSPAQGKIDYKDKTEWNLENLKPLPGKHSYLWVVDEASLIDNNLMDQLTYAAEKVNAKVVFSGDMQQFLSIGAGNAFTQMVEKDKISHTEMREIVRQKEIWRVYGSGELSKDDRKQIRSSAGEHKEITGIDIKVEFIKRNVPGKLQELNKSGKVKLEDFTLARDPDKPVKNVVIHKDSHIRIAVKQAAEGNIKETIKQLGDDIKQIRSRTKRLDRISIEYAKQNQAGRDNSCILTASNRDRDYLNREVHRLLKESRFLGPEKEFEAVNIYDKPVKIQLSAGDKIMFLRTDKQLDVKNGSRGDLQEISGNILKVKLDDGRLINVDLERYKNITHGYAFTSYKAQGMSVDRAFINLDTSQGNLNSRNKFYVDVSRVKCEVDIFTDSKPKLYRAVALSQEKLSADIFNKQVLKNKAAALNRSSSDLNPDQGIKSERVELPSRDISKPAAKRDYSETLRSIFRSADRDVSEPDFLKPGFKCKCDLGEELEKSIEKGLDKGIIINPVSITKDMDEDRGMSMF